MSQLLDQMRDRIRTLHYSIRTEDSYVLWAKQFILFHRKRHPLEMGEAEVGEFLTYLAVERNVAASTQNQALSAILFLYKVVLDRPLERVEDVLRAKKPHRLPVVFTREQVRAVLARMQGDKAVMASLLYGSGLRLMECLRLRVKDVDFGQNHIVVRDGKGQFDVSASLLLPLHQVGKLDSWEDFQDRQAMTLFTTRSTAGTTEPMSSAPRANGICSLAISPAPRHGILSRSSATA